MFVKLIKSWSKPNLWQLLSINRYDESIVWFLNWKQNTWKCDNAKKKKKKTHFCLKNDCNKWKVVQFQPVSALSAVFLCSTHIVRIFNTIPLKASLCNFSKMKSWINKHHRICKICWDCSYNFFQKYFFTPWSHICQNLSKLIIFS